MIHLIIFYPQKGISNLIIVIGGSLSSVLLRSIDVQALTASGIKNIKTFIHYL
jgi:hypothetical protein